MHQSSKCFATVNIKLGCSVTLLQVFVDNHRAFHSLFEVMNEYEEIVTSVMLQGTGFDELRTAMQKLRERFEKFQSGAMPKYW
jgi:hypothetical protein